MEMDSDEETKEDFADNNVEPILQAERNRTKLWEEQNEKRMNEDPQAQSKKRSHDAMALGEKDPIFVPGIEDDDLKAIANPSSTPAGHFQLKPLLGPGSPGNGLTIASPTLRPDGQHIALNILKEANHMSLLKGIINYSAVVTDTTAATLGLTLAEIGFDNIIHVRANTIPDEYLHLRVSDAFSNIEVGDSDIAMAFRNTRRFRNLDGTHVEGAIIRQFLPVVEMKVQTLLWNGETVSEGERDTAEAFLKAAIQQETEDMVVIKGEIKKISSSMLYPLD